MHLAAEFGHVDIVTALINHGALINTQNKENYIPLHIASKKGNVKIVEKLLKHELALPNFTRYGETAIHGNLEVLRALIASGANVDQNSGIKTALHYATEKGHISIVNELLKNNADPYLKKCWYTEKEKTAIDIANDHKDPVIKSELLNCFANVTSLNLALKDSQSEFVKV